MESSCGLHAREQQTHTQQHSHGLRKQQSVPGGILYNYMLPVAVAPPQIIVYHALI